MVENIVRLHSRMADSNVGSLLVTDPLNIRWLSGFTGSFGVVLLTQDSGAFITDSRYAIQAKNQVSGLDVVSFGNPKTLEDTLKEAIVSFGVTEIGFEQSVTYATWQKRAETFPEVKWAPAPDLVPELRKIKSAEEVRRIKAACELADACMEHVVRMVQPGVPEYDIHLDVEFFYRRNGAELAFEPIVVSGPNSAKPHGKAGDRKLTQGDFVTIDCGGKLDGYCSDITRTFVVGKASDRHREIYEQVLRAEQECCALCEAGTEGKAVDAHAREVLAEKDLAQYFGHGLGHGLGLNVHDPGGLSPRSTDVLAAGMVMTVEPGVYIDGFGGVRIEDDVLVTENGPETLTHFRRDLIET